MRTIPTLLLAWLMLLAMPHAEAAGGSSRKLEQAQTVFSSAMRWSDYEGAWQMVDPALREAQPLTDLQLERYNQLQVSSYREGGNGELEDGTVVRSVEVGVINRHTQAERSVRYQEKWRWDPKAKRWWQVAGLPDFWEGK
ncbi:hypothetical protein MNQ95_06015 [Pseudoxanthomonas daejeonensis]|jgi:hypothetical protein|uniref:Secreted protein n=1 Tax=Pseudoxanthomonas daejeonensis TaxID=266062 RepID=A0ABQ6ZBQ0_9GAMM|nr:hypothetical protein [Pseudoxanthomonas daejeonensis]KAF1697468.1 hypothetical protein CSC65_00945 [Pseudoxanthomonas daejeonensis]UNK58642.1 hypothetical protein MNQ95_06015 [Pseudoxanthomonas daejeonensis]